MSAHVSVVCRSAYGYLQQPRFVTRVLSAEATKTLVYAFTSSRFDYCNSLLFGISDNLLRCLQAVQNVTARLVTGSRRREHITPDLMQPHYLPLRQRIEFKLAVQSDEWPVYNIWGMTDSTDDFHRPTSPHVRFQELAQVWLIHSLLLERVRGTTNLSIYVTLHMKHTFLEFRRRLLKTLLFC